jgi:hypothetical protein
MVGKRALEKAKRSLIVPRCDERAGTLEDALGYRRLIQQPFAVTVGWAITRAGQFARHVVLDR